MPSIIKEVNVSNNDLPKSRKPSKNELSTIGKNINKVNYTCTLLEIKSTGKSENNTFMSFIEQRLHSNTYSRFLQQTFIEHYHK
jgi:hypothetical protein